MRHPFELFRVIINRLVLSGGLVTVFVLSDACFGADSRGFSKGFEECVLQSSVLPEAEIRWHLPRQPSAPQGLWRGDLTQAGQRKAELTASRFPGYGSAIWNHAGDTGRAEYLIPFIGPNPANSVGAASVIDGFLFTGLGSDLYYGGERNNLPLIRAAEGVWKVKSGCRRFLMYNR